jgi:hypothetical protein
MAVGPYVGQFVRDSVFYALRQAQHEGRLPIGWDVSKLVVSPEDARALWAVRVLDGAELNGYQFDWHAHNWVTVRAPDMRTLFEFDCQDRMTTRISTALALVSVNSSLDPDASAGRP